MEDNAISKVRKVEADAEKTIHAALKESEHMVEQARSQAAQLKSEAEENAVQEAQAKVNQVNEQAQKGLRLAEKELDVKMDALKESAMQRQNEAIQRIYDALA